MSSLEERLNHYVAYGPAWLVGGVLGGGLVWVGRDSTAGMLAGVIAGIVMFVVTAMIGAVRRREEKLKEQLRARGEEAASEDRILASIPAMVWRTNDRSTRTFVSARFQEFAGVDETCVGTSEWEDFVLPEDWQRALGAHRMAWLRHEPYSVQYRLRNAQGEYRRVIDYGAPCFHVDGVFFGYVGVVIDIHDWRTSESGRDVDAATLQQQCREMSAEMTELIDRHEALQKDSVAVVAAEQSKSDFIAALAEDLAEPVEDAQNAVEMLQKGSLDSTQAGYAERIHTAANKLGCVLLRCFELATSAHEPARHESREIEVRPLLRWTWEQLAESAADRGVELESLIDEDVPVAIEADLDRLRSAVVGIQEAALRAMPHGHMAIEAKMESTPGGTNLLRVSCVRDGDEIPLDLLERAFYPPEAIGGEGPGLGMHAPRRDAIALGGDAGVRQQDNGSVEFWMTVQADSTGADGRRYGRLGQEAVTSNFGPVLDLSMGGMRVQCHHVPDYVFDVQLGDEQDTLHLRAEVAWKRPTDDGEHEIGLRFIELKPSEAARLSRLAGRNRQRRSFESAA
jgi:PAS domain S-box-containing protein